MTLGCSACNPPSGLSVVFNPTNNGQCAYLSLSYLGYDLPKKNWMTVR